MRKYGLASAASGPSGMTKNADQFVGNGGMFQMTGWTPDLGSNVVADGLVVSEAAGIIVARGTGKNTVLGSSNSNLSLRRNGVEVATSTWSGNNPASWQLFYAGTVSVADVFTLYAGNGGDAYTFMVAGSTVKHLTSASPVQASGLQLGASHEYTPASSWVVSPAAKWLASWSLYPDTLKTGNGFIVQGSGNVTFTQRLQMSSSSAIGKASRILVNGVVVWTFASVSTQTAGPTTSDPISVVNGDIVTIEVMVNGGISTQRTLTSPNTWWTMNPV